VGVYEEETSKLSPMGRKEEGWSAYNPGELLYIDSGIRMEPH